MISLSAIAISAKKIFNIDFLFNEGTCKIASPKVKSEAAPKVKPEADPKAKASPKPKKPTK